MNDLPIYIDIDGTLTDSPARGGNPIPERIQEVRRLVASGETVVIWSGTGTAYARDFVKRHGLEPAIGIGKPGLCVDDNPTVRSMTKCVVHSPEAFFRKPHPGPL